MGTFLWGTKAATGAAESVGRPWPQRNSRLEIDSTSNYYEWRLITGNDFVSKFCTAKVRCAKRICVAKISFCTAICEFCVANLKYNKIWGFAWWKSVSSRFAVTPCVISTIAKLRYRFWKEPNRTTRISTVAKWEIWFRENHGDFTGLHQFWTWPMTRNQTFLALTMESQCCFYNNSAIKTIPHVTVSYYRCCCINEPVNFSHCVRLKLQYTVEYLCSLHVSLWVSTTFRYGLRSKPHVHLRPSKLEVTVENIQYCGHRSMYRHVHVGLGDRTLVILHTGNHKPSLHVCPLRKLSKQVSVCRFQFAAM